MKVSDEERETLHTILDYLINTREYLEGQDKSSFLPGNSYRWGWSGPRDEFFNNASVFLRRVIGSKIHSEQFDYIFQREMREDQNGGDVLADLANSIRTFLPLFLSTGHSSYGREDAFIVKIINDFMGIYWGDEPRFFSVLPRRQGLHKRPFRLAKLRLTALDWDKYLSAVGVRPQERHSIISNAYRTDWEAIRKWAKSIDEQFDIRSRPPRDIEQAIADYTADPDSIRAQIEQDGLAYWLERGTAQSGK